jgi:hypothetical protein
MRATNPILAVVIAAMLCSPLAGAQTPIPKTPPQLTIKWLASLTLSPTSVGPGAHVTGTVVLLRPAVSDLEIGLSLSESNPVEGNILAADGAVMPSLVTVRAGSDRATFTISTTAPRNATRAKIFAVGAAYGTERLSSSFTLLATVLRK